jgi:phospholipase/carboxylesterase
MWKQKIYQKCESKNPKYLVILLHGYGANGENLIELADFFMHHGFQDACYIAPNAIEPWEGGFPDAYQWFSLANGIARKDLGDMAENIKDSSQILNDFIEQKLSELNLTRKNLILIGFSQGCMMALYQALHSKEKIAGVIGFSGKLILPEYIGEQTNSKPEICLIHGVEDSVVDFDNFLSAKEVLEENGFSFESHAIENLDHSIDMRCVELASQFIKKIIK